MSNSNNHFCDNSVQLNIPSSHSPNNYPTLAMSNTTITSPKPPPNYKKPIYPASHPHGTDADFTESGNDDTFLSRNRYDREANDLVHDQRKITERCHGIIDQSCDNSPLAGANRLHMPCFEPPSTTSIRNDSIDNRKKNRTNCDFGLDEANDIFATELKDPNVSGTTATSSSSPSTSNELVRIKQEIQSKDLKCSTRSNAYPMGQHREQPTFTEPLYMDTSNNCWESLINLRQKILRHRQRLQQEQTTKYYYDSHSKCNDGAALNPNAFGGIDRYDPSDRLNQMVYSHERQNPYFGAEKLPPEACGSFNNRNDKMYANDGNYEKMLGESTATVAQSPQPPPSSSILSQENIYGMLDFQPTDKLSNINRMMSANENCSDTNAAAFSSLANYRKLSAIEASHASSPLNEPPTDCSPYRDTTNAEASAVHHMRKVSGFDKTLDKLCSAGKNRDDVEFLKL